MILPHTQTQCLESWGMSCLLLRWRQALGSWPQWGKLGQQAVAAVAAAEVAADVAVVAVAVAAPAVIAVDTEAVTET